MDRQVALHQIQHRPQVRRLLEAVVGLKTIRRKHRRRRRRRKHRAVDHQVVIGICRACDARNTHEIHVVAQDLHGDAFVVRL